LKFKMKHIKAFTYKPKIEFVLNGLCKQTIRPFNQNIKIGDEILFHGWKRVPYKSEWSWRFEVNLTNVINIEIRNNGIIFPKWRDLIILWSHELINKLAIDDFISPPTGIGLRDLFNEMYDLREPKYFQILRWGEDNSYNLKSNEII